MNQLRLKLSRFHHRPVNAEYLHRLFRVVLFLLVLALVARDPRVAARPTVRLVKRPRLGVLPAVTPLVPVPQQLREQGPRLVVPVVAVVGQPLKDNGPGARKGAVAVLKN